MNDDLPVAFLWVDVLYRVTIVSGYYRHRYRQRVQLFFLFSFSKDRIEDDDRVQYPNMFILDMGVKQELNPPIHLFFPRVCV